MKKALLIPLLFLTACGGYRTVRVSHRSPGLASARPAIEAVYLALKRPEPLLKEKTDGLAALAGELRPDMDLQDLGRQVAGILRIPGSRVCAFAVEKGDVLPGAFAPRFAPTGVLELSLTDPALSSVREERTVVRNDKKKGRRKVKTQVWVYSASISARIRLLAWPGREEVDSWSARVSVSEDRFDESRAPASWYVSKEEKLFKELAARIGTRYAGRRADRRRPLFSVEDDKDSEKAVSLACKGKWEKAAAIWRGRASSGGGWRDLLGLAVAAEVSKDHGGALELYRKARAAAKGDKKAKPVRWSEIYRDLENAMSFSGTKECGGDWFGVRTAVLPFSDQTTSIEGPELLRRLLFERLEQAGYDLLPLERTDEILSRHGYSDGGQLAAAKPEALKRWLGAGRLIFTDISDYGEIMAGIYNRRMVAGSAKLWEAGSPEVSFEEAVIRVSTQKNLIGGLALQLTRGLAERMIRKPLGYEAGVFSRRLSSNFPARLK